MLKITCEVHFTAETRRAQSRAEATSTGRTGVLVSGRQLDSIEVASLNQHLPKQNPSVFVHIENSNARTSDGSQAHDGWTYCTEVSRPLFLARVEQRHHLVGFGIEAGQIGALEQIAADASQSQIAIIIPSAVLLWDHMLNLEGREGRMLLLESAILTTIVRPITNELPESGIHEACGDACFRTCRAFDCRMLMRSMPSTYAEYSRCSASLSVPSFDLPANSSMRPCNDASARSAAIFRATSGVRQSVSGSSSRSR